MNKLLIYPYSQEDSYFLFYPDLVKEYMVKSLVVMGKIHEKSDWTNMGSQDIAISDDFEGELEKCDSVLFISTYFELIKDVYVARIKKAIEQGKEVILSFTIYKECKKELEGYEKVKILDKLIDKSEYPNMHSEKLGSPSIPVVTVLSPGENCEKFEAQLEMKKAFERKGYKILQFGSKEYASLFGMEVFPDFLFANNVCLSDKVDMFNFYVNKMLLHTDYDAVIISMPGGMLPIDKTFHNHYGELSLVVSHAFDIDINVLCTYYNPELTYDTIKELCSAVGSRLGCITEYVFISNMQFRILEEGKLDYMRLEKEFCLNTMPKIEDGQIKICQYYEAEKRESFFDAIVSELEDNISII